MTAFLSLAAALDLRAAADDANQHTDAPRVRVLAYNGGIITVARWGRVVIDLANLELPESIPLLADHDQRVGSTVGHGSPTVEDGALVIDGTLSGASDAARQVADSAARGLPWRASVGVEVLERRNVRAGETIEVNGRSITAESGGFTLISRGRLREVSVVPVASDDDTTIQITQPPQNRNNRMNDHSAAVAAGAASDLDTEVNRRAEILAACGDKHAELAAQAIAGDWTLDDTKLAILRASRPTPVIGRGARADVPTADRLAAAMLLHAGRSDVAELVGAEAAQAGADLRARSLVDIAAAALTEAGREVPRERDALIRAAFSNTDMPTALTVAGDKLALRAYSRASQTWRLICHRLATPNFREQNLVRPLVSNSAFEEVAPDGEIKHVALGEATYTVQAKTFGKMAVMTRQDVINDDLQAFATIFSEFGQLAAMKIAAEVFNTLAAAGTFFHNNNSNLLTGADSALTFDAYGAAVAKLRSQTDGDGNPIDLEPGVLLVPPQLEGTARSILNSTAVVGGVDPVVGAANPWIGSAKLGVEPRLTDADQWYLFAEPEFAPALVVAFLNGDEGPTVEQIDPGANVLGVGVRGYIDFGVALADPRGAVRANGS